MEFWTKLTYSYCISKAKGGNATSGGNAAFNKVQKPRGKWYTPRNVKPDTLDVFGKPYKYDTTTRRWDKQDKDVTGTAQVAKVAESLNTKPITCVASFASVIQGESKDAFNKLSC